MNGRIVELSAIASLGLITLGCGGSKNSPPNTPTVGNTVADPTVSGVPAMPTTLPQSIWSTSPVEFDHLPEAISITEIQLFKSLNASVGGKLTVDSFKDLIMKARPANASQVAATDWAYAPWYSGTFMTPAGQHHFQLYLGGRGKLSFPDGRVGLFLFDKPSVRATSDQPGEVDGANGIRGSRQE